MSSDAVSTSKQDLVEQVLRFTKSFHHLKLSLTRDMPDRAAYNLLFPLSENDKRASDLADIVRSDPSTVSRHIAHLVSNGLAQRVADQHDGRATLVSLTDKGRDFCSAMRNQRESGLARLIENWSDEDAQTFTKLMTRFNDDMDTNFQHVLDGIRQAYDKAESITESSSSDKEHA